MSKPLTGVVAPVLDLERMTISREQYEAAQRLLRRSLRESLPTPLPWDWKEQGDRPPMRHFVHRSGVSVLVSVGLHDGRYWLHVSATAPGRVPTYAELCRVKELFVGRRRQAIQVFPVVHRHINLHEHCLHLWACLDEAGDGLPAFGRFGMI